MNWIVTWVFISMSFIACPDPPSIHDPYRDEIHQVNTTLMACYDREEIPLHRYFETYKEAFEFVNNGKDRCENDFMIGGCDLQNFKIKELR